MANKLALMSFEFTRHKGLVHDANLDRATMPNRDNLHQNIQPVIDRAFEDIKKCLQRTISADFAIASKYMFNMNSIMHMGILSWTAAWHDNTQDPPQTSLMATVKFYKLAPTITYKVTIDIDEIANTEQGVIERDFLFKVGLTNKHCLRFAQALNEKFHLLNRIEVIPILLRGYYNAPRFISTSNNRFLEFDIENETLQSIESAYQNIEVVKSSSLGNMLILNGRPSISEGDIEQSAIMLDRAYTNYDNKRVLILGGGDGSLLSAVLNENVSFVDLVEIDMEIIEIASEFFCGSSGIKMNELHGEKHHITIGDARDYLLNAFKSGQKWDIIFNDMTHEPLGQQSVIRRSLISSGEPVLTQLTNAWYFFEPFYNLVMECLDDDGIFIMKSNNVNNPEQRVSFEKFLEDANYLVMYEARKGFVPTSMEMWYFYTIQKKKSGLTEGQECSRTEMRIRNESTKNKL